ncbi:ubiquinone-dependent pyruvate dehydrogenase [Demequina sp. SYSU T00068]|uniref:ubiquinone-dependent pyruvate dehydrogenase n=1 Tax=Demequina lignilytica TaxID=3051663 RepID=UPI002601B37A|nr:ubiquinone-dependent pyruvate dehydrogenase [Demequina sp. SYSU T00068]MDN4489295.1 ubiquinone-dependent pyruvate dehydrogenase [Demequina sp. SYSU T00068]
MSRNVAQLFVDTLVDAGVSRVWGLPGDSLNAFGEAMRRDGRLEWIHVRHEEVAAFAAGADSAVAGGLAVAVGSCGPGNLHFINGLYDAHRNRTPVLAIASHIPLEQIGSGYFQETHPQDLFRECSVYSELVSDASQLPWVLETAMRAAVENDDVAVVVVPGDVFYADAPDRRASAPIRRSRPVVVPGDDELRRAAELLDGADRVTILAGAGAAGAHDEVVALAKRLQAPVVHALRGKEHLEHDNPYDVGMTGLIGFASGYRAMLRADALLVLGSDFPYRQFYPEDARIIQVDLRGEQLGRRTPIDLGLVGDVGPTATALGRHLRARTDGDHLEDSLRHYRRTRKELDALADDDGKAPIHPQYLTRLLSDRAEDDAVFTADVGSPTVWAARYIRMTRDRRLLGSFNHGSMANALPQALGAQAEDRDRQVISLSGDGGLAMLMGDLITAVQNHLPVKVVVYDNASLNFVELEMKAAGLPTYATDLENPDFAAVARAMGMTGIRVEDPADLPDAVDRLLAADGPALLDVVCAREELALPPSIEAAQAKGFALWALRTVMSGRGDELLDLADTNLWRRLASRGGAIPAR